MCRVKGNYIPVLFSLPTTYLPTVLIWVILESRAWDKGRHILFWECDPREQEWDRGEWTGGKGKVQAKQGSVIEWSTSVHGYLVQNLPRILNKLWLRTVCLRDEKKKDLCLSSYHLCAEGCSRGALTPPWGDPHWCYSITSAATEKLWDRKLDSWRKPEMRHRQHRAGWNLPRAVHQSCGWNRRWKRWETVHRRHLRSL